MKTLPCSGRLFAGLICCGLFSVSALAVTEEHLTNHFTVQPGGKLVVQVDMGSIDVTTNSANAVVVDVWRKISRGSKSAEQAYLREHPVEMTQDSDTVTIRCRQKSKMNWSWGGKNRNDVKYSISVPEKFNAKLDTQGGPISVGDLAGEVKADTSGGGLQFSRIHGPVAGETSGGGIHMNDCEGNLKIETSGGGITVTGGSGSLKAETSGGAVTVKRFQGPADLHTSGGGITLDDVAGEIRGETSGGGIKAALPPPSGPVKLSTSAGGITIHLPASAKFDLDAETSAGNVSSELPITIVGKHSSDRLKGQVNGGGPPMVLRTSAGSIHILKGERTLAEEPK